MATRSDLKTSQTGTTQIQLADLRFDLTVGGDPDGATVMLLHGFPQTSEAWTAIVRDLVDQGYRVVAPDQRGYSPGARPRTRSAYRLAELVGDAVGLADACGAPRFHVVGHDWGGIVGWALAAQRPERLRSLTVLSTPHPAALARSMLGAQSLRSLYAAWFQLPVVPEAVLGWRHGAVLRAVLRASGLDQDHADAYAQQMGSPAALAAALAWYQASNAVDLAALGPIEVPTLYLWGDRDQALGPAAARRTAEHVRGPYRFEVLRGAGHWLPERHADEVLPHLLGHLARS